MSFFVSSLRAALCCLLSSCHTIKQHREAVRVLRADPVITYHPPAPRPQPMSKLEALALDEETALEMLRHIKSP